jgi:asparagine synthase (glutamine-hydrolysing)
MLLHYEDRDSMAHSVEARVPFLDVRVAELALSLPDDFRIRQGETKVVLRKAMEGIIPEVVRTRQDKIGFGTPEDVWLRKEGTEWFSAAVRRAHELAPDLFVKSQVDALFSETVGGSRAFRWDIWRIVSFGAWMDRFGVALT